LFYLLQENFVAKIAILSFIKDKNGEEIYFFSVFPVFHAKKQSRPLGRAKALRWVILRFQRYQLQTSQMMLRVDDLAGEDAEGVEHRVVVLQRKQTNASRIKIEK